MFCPKTFKKIDMMLGPLEMDLFVSRLTAQLPSYVSLRPDPEAMLYNAFQSRLGSGTVEPGFQAILIVKWSFSCSQNTFFDKRLFL